MTRTIATARARQLLRRKHRAAKRNAFGPPPPRHVDDTDAAARQQLHDARAARGRLTTLVARVDERIARLERRLERKKAS